MAKNFKSDSNNKGNDKLLIDWKADYLKSEEFRKPILGAIAQLEVIHNPTKGGYRQIMFAIEVCVNFVMLALTMQHGGKWDGTAKDLVGAIYMNYAPMSDFIEGLADEEIFRKGLGKKEVIN